MTNANNRALYLGQRKTMELYIIYFVYKMNQTNG